MIINEDLLSPMEIRIARLTSTINAFKKYDKERTQYVKQLQNQCEMKMNRAQHMIESVEDFLSDTDACEYDNAVEIIMKLIRKNCNLKCNLEQSKIVSEVPDVEVERLGTLTHGELIDLVMKLTVSRNTLKKANRDLRELVTILNQQIIVNKLRPI